ncbi:immunity 71 family protein [Rugamonas sp. A1-17]|nr:immunity 71 family protein [Rugamonas sp. A1-17]
MKQSISTNAVMLPSQYERQQIFYWLQRISSATAWRRIYEYYKAWAVATENSLREADQHGWGSETSLPQSEYALILKGLAHCEEGVKRLASGDKRVFRFDANGEFAMARRMLSHWTQMLERIELGENGIKKNTPLWAEFCEALVALGQVWGECAVEILEPRYIDEPALTLYGIWLQEELANMPFPNELKAVPDPIDNTFVRTNDYTPCSGIWEPVEVPSAPFLSLFSGAPKPQPPFTVVGAMNYLHGGSKAPKITVETANDNIDLATTWRLLWRDDRYSDGTIPEEEAHYRFKKPDAVLPTPPSISVPNETIWGDSGTAAKATGKWLVESDLSGCVMLQMGEKLPLYQGREVRWVLADK